MEQPPRARTAKVRYVVAGVLTLIVFVVLGRGAYGKTARVRECKALAREINPVLDEIQRAAEKKKDGAAYRAAARNYAKLAALVPKIASPGLADEAKEYADVLKATEKALRAGATALDEKNEPQIAQGRRDLERLVRRERTIMARIDVYCRTN